MKRKLSLKSLKILEKLTGHFEFDDRKGLFDEILTEIDLHLNKSNNPRIEYLAIEYGSIIFHPQESRSPGKPDLTSERWLGSNLWGYLDKDPTKIESLDWMRLGVLFALILELDERSRPTKQEEFAYQFWKKSMINGSDTNADEIRAYLASKGFPNEKQSSFEVKCTRWKKEWRFRFNREKGELAYGYWKQSVIEDTEPSDNQINKFLADNGYRNNSDDSKGVSNGWKQEWRLRYARERDVTFKS